MRNDGTNDLYRFLVEQGVPIASLPVLMEVSKAKLTPMITGYNKESKTKKFYLCICNSGHETCCGELEWSYSGWNIRVKGENVLFFKGEWKFDLVKIPISQDILFVVSKRTKVSECAQIRFDIVCVSKNKQKLVRKVQRPETYRRNHK